MSLRFDWWELWWQRVVRTPEEIPRENLSHIKNPSTLKSQALPSIFRDSSPSGPHPVRFGCRTSDVGDGHWDDARDLRDPTYIPYGRKSNSRQNCQLWNGLVDPELWACCYREQQFQPLKTYQEAKGRAWSVANDSLLLTCCINKRTV